MRYLSIVLTLAILGCGDDGFDQRAGTFNGNPVAPSPQPASIAGTWVGTATYTRFDGPDRVIVAMQATFTQAGGNFTGQYEMANGVRGTLSGVMDRSAMAATQDFRGGDCTGSASVSGSVSGSTLRWTVPSVASSNCSWFTNVEIVLNR